jgi:ribose transport system ATP-binding protein
MKILSGAYKPDPGSEISIAGRPVEITDPLSAKAHGISIIYQELSLAPNLSVAENMYLGIEVARRGFVDRAAMRKGAQAVLDRLGTSFNASAIVGRLSIAEQQQVEIARALHAESRILVMDEPTTALSSRETEKLFELIHRLRADGLAIIYISHRMDEVYALSDRVSVLRDGSYVGTLVKDEISAERLVKMMVGRDLGSFFTREHGQKPGAGEVMLEVDGLKDVRGMVKGCSFTLHRGECLALRAS